MEEQKTNPEGNQGTPENGSSGNQPETQSRELEIFQGPKISNIALYLDKKIGSGKGTSLIPLVQTLANYRFSEPEVDALVNIAFNPEELNGTLAQKLQGATIKTQYFLEAVVNHYDSVYLRNLSRNYAGFKDFVDCMRRVEELREGQQSGDTLGITYETSMRLIDVLDEHRARVLIEDIVGGCQTMGRAARLLEKVLDESEREKVSPETILKFRAGVLDIEED